VHASCAETTLDTGRTAIVTYAAITRTAER
jgi:hypothetical protein